MAIKTGTYEYEVCDYCERESDISVAGGSHCTICGKDLCSRHSLYVRHNGRSYLICSSHLTGLNLDVGGDR